MTTLSSFVSVIEKVRTAVRFIKDKELRSMPPDIRTDGRITRVLTRYIARPLVVISKDLEYMDQSVLKSIIDAELKIFLSVYINAIKAMVNIEGMNVNDVITRINNTNINYGEIIQNRFPNVRHVGNAGFEDIKELDDQVTALLKYGKEDDDSTPTNATIKEPIDTTTVEANTGKRKIRSRRNVVLEDGDKLIKLEQQFIKNYDITLTVTATIEENGKERKVERVITIPIIIYPIIRFTNIKELADELIGEKDISFFSRLEEYRAGAISLSDLIFATDLVKDYKRRRIKNGNDIAKYLRDMVNRLDVNDLLVQRISFAKRFNIYIISTDDMVYLNNLVKGNILKDRYKEKILDALLAFSISIVDTDKERVYRIMDGIPSFSVTLFKALKKDKDVDVNEIFKNLMLNKSPF